MNVDQLKKISNTGKKLPLDKNFFPVRFNKDEIINPWDHIHKIAYISNLVWQYSEYCGYGTPWHEKDPLFYPTQAKSLRRFFLYMENIDVDFEAFCGLSFPLHTHNDFQTVNKLLGSDKNHWKWTKTLRKYAGSREAVNRVSNFLWEFFKLQIEYLKKIEIYKKSVIRSNPADGFKTKHYELYHALHDRINNIRHYNVEPTEWLKRKFQRTLEAYPDTQMVHLRTIVNKNGLDPDMSEVKAILRDEWYPIREFLELSDKCQFPDGCIPKGWMPGSGDYEDPRKITSITKDGFYFYQDGTQRRGTRHYIKNSYLTIKCDPSNFEQFKEHWKDYAYIAKLPTWEEYSNYALHPGYWDEEGRILQAQLQGRMKPVKWRKRP